MGGGGGVGGGGAGHGAICDWVAACSEHNSAKRFLPVYQRWKSCCGNGFVIKHATL